MNRFESGDPARRTAARECGRTGRQFTYPGAIRMLHTKDRVPMEIDLTQEASGHDAAPLVDRHRARIVIAATLTIGLLVGGGLGVAYGKRAAGRGSLVLTNTELVVSTARQTPTLRWSLANFAQSPGKIISVTVDGKAAPVTQSEISGNTLSDFSTDLQCASGKEPQLTITLTDGDGVMHDFGYLVGKAEWKAICKP